MIDALLDEARALSPQVVGAIGAVAAVLVVFAATVQLRVRALRRELDGAQEELVDERTGLLPRSALRVRLGAELAWAAASRTPLAVAVLRIRGSRFEHAARVLRHSMREEESAFLLGEQHVAVELWGADADAATAATRRLGEDLAAAGHPVVDAGLACAPRDGSDVDTLLTLARRDLRPIDEHRSGQGPRTTPRALRGQLAHALLVLLAALPPFVALGALLLLAWRLVPAAVEPALATGSRGSRDLLVALVTLVGLPLAAALLHATCWQAGGRWLPRSRPRSQWGWQPVAAVAALVTIPLAWGIHAPGTPASATPAFGTTLAVLALLVLAIVHARQLVHVPVLGLVVLVAAGALLAIVAVEQLELPVVANAGRLLAAAALGAVLARQVERASWLVFLAVLAAGIDMWSVWAETGVTNQLLDSEAASSDRLVDLLLFTGPAIGEVPPFAIGTTDLVFLALFVAWAHDWRLDVRVVSLALLGAAWTAAIVTEVSGDVVPMLPFLSLAVVLVVAARSVVLRHRVARWLQAGTRPPATG